MRKISTKLVTPVSADLDTTGQGATTIIVKPASKPKAVKQPAAAKPVTKLVVKLPAKPVVSKADAEAAAEQAKRAEATVAMRKAVAKRYSGASKAFHTSRATSPGDILGVLTSPKHRIATDTPPTVRDASLAHVLCDIPSGTNVLSILELGADLGVISRLASIGVLANRQGKAVIVSRAAMRAVTKQCRPTPEQLADKAA